MRALYQVLPFMIVSALWAQEAALEPVAESAVELVDEIEIPEPELISVSVEMRNKSWFTDHVGTAVIHFETVVDAPEILPSGGEAVSFIEIDVQETPDSKLGKSSAMVHFVLRKTGVVTFPSLDFVADGRIYRTAPQEIMVSEPFRSDAMAVTLTPSKLRVYVGEPLRLDFKWHCDLEAGRLQALQYYPAFFNDSTVEIVIPRNTAADDQQVGLPLGGRRVIATRTKLESNVKRLGTVELPLYLRIQTPGKYLLPATRLACAYLSDASRNFGQYAAHFNNELFAAEDSSVRFERIYAETEAIEIEVLPLPEAGKLPEFSGLFNPVRVAVVVKPNELTVGHIMEVEMAVFSDAPHGMLEFPKLSRQRGLRGRFLVDDELGRLWRKDGTTFRARVRALSAAVEAFPALRIQTFDAESGEYQMLVTKPVPLVVNQNEGKNFIDVSSYAGTQISLVGQPEGIWHNLEANVMDDLLNKSVGMLASWFWLLIALGPVAFVLLLPFVRERRRRALDAQYRERIEAYDTFQKLADNDPEKWTAFLDFLAVSFQSGKRAWTVADSRRELKSIGADAADIEQVVALHATVDAQDFHPEHPEAQTRDLAGIGKRVLNLIGKGAVVLLLAAFAMPSDAQASDWSEAEALFAEAVAAPAGSEAAAALYAESALKFQAAAVAGERPGVAWYNAGNAWFKTGALGRSIAAYREARVYRPFDTLVKENLLAARSLTLNDVPVEGSPWLTWPMAWLKAVLVLVAFAFWFCLLFAVRYRRRSWFIGSFVCFVLAVCNIALLIHASKEVGRHGVVIMDEVIARKGPAYSYAKAFGEALQDGLEFTLLETRGDWGLIALPDGRQCWALLSQAQLLTH